jgi:hypothetical protein
MRFTMLMIPKGYEKAAAGAMPHPKIVKYNEALQKAGVLLPPDGLHAPAMGARVSFSGGKPKVSDGPFAEAKEVLGGYWMKKPSSVPSAAPVPTTKSSRFVRSRRCRTSQQTSRQPRPDSKIFKRSPRKRSELDSPIRDATQFIRASRAIEKNSFRSCRFQLFSFDAYVEPALAGNNNFGKFIRTQKQKEQQRCAT